MLRLTVFVLCLAVLGAVFAEDKAISKDEIEFRAGEASKWAAEKLSGYIKVPGNYYLQRTSNLQYKLGETTQFLMTLDIAVNNPKTNKNIFKKCNVEIADTPTQNTRLLSRVECQENTAL